MTTEKFLFDTYAILEIINANKNYEKYTDSIMIINDFIFAELCYRLFREKVQNSEYYLNKAAKAIIQVQSETIKEAMRFRLENKSKNLSMTDCISYMMAKSLGLKFLTGDKEFENMENVEFVKGNT